MFFILILILSALSLAGAAAYFSVFGLAQIFAGSFLAVIIMGGVLEAGKLVAASFAYRYWDNMRTLMRTYLIAAIIVLMVITSMGVFGFLSTAYQKDILPLQLKKQKIELLEHEKNELTQLRDERLLRKQQIDADIAALPNDFVTGRRRLLEAFGPELKQLKIDLDDYALRLQEINAEVYSLKNATLIQEAHIGPIVFIAKAFNRTTDDTTKWMIFLIIFAFDPLAVMLTIGANLAIVERQKKREQNTARIQENKWKPDTDLAAPQPAIAQQNTAAKTEPTPDQQPLVNKNLSNNNPSAPSPAPAIQAGKQTAERSDSSAPDKPATIKKPASAPDPQPSVNKKPPAPSPAPAIQAGKQTTAGRSDSSAPARPAKIAQTSNKSHNTVREISDLLNLKLASTADSSTASAQQTLKTGQAGKTKAKTKYRIRKVD